MPTIGEVHLAREIGLGVSNQFDRYIWHACVVCGSARWVRLSNGKPRSSMCLSCNDKRIQQLNLGKGRPDHAFLVWSRSVTNHAIRDKHLIRQPCEVCGQKAEAHHDNYGEPLKVRWLCPEHHWQLHRHFWRDRELAKFGERHDN